MTKGNRLNGHNAPFTLQAVYPMVRGFLRRQNHLQSHHIPPEIWCSIHTTDVSPCGSLCLVKHPCPSSTCDIETKHPFTSSSLMLPCYTERRPSHNLIYSMDHTFSYRSKKFICASSLSPMHTHGSEIRGGNFKHFKTSIGYAR